jgi:hypothetical protein
MKSLKSAAAVVLFIAAATTAAGQEVATSAAPTQGAADALELRLSCNGVQQQGETQRTSIEIEDDWDITKSASGTASTTRITQVPRTVHLEFSGGGGRIRLPWVEKGQDSWFDLYDLVIDEDSIEGRFRVGMLTKPRFRIDRRTGDIESRDMAFVGSCERITEARKF